MASAFIRKKTAILEQLSVPSDSYEDLSPKGSVDEEIRELVNALNSYEGLVTTSSCSGRISVFLEGKSKDIQDVREHEGNDAGENQAFASIGGKGGGGRWLLVSHAPLDEFTSDSEHHVGSFVNLFQLQLPLDGSSTQLPAGIASRQRFIHFKFEPMILHILASDSTTAQLVLKAAQQSGFRESGAINLSLSNTLSQVRIIDGASSSPIVIAIRATGLAFDNIIGVARNTNGVETLTALVSESYLQTLVHIANHKFTINKDRMNRFQAALAKSFGSGRSPGKDGDQEWEDVAARRARKRDEGLRRRQELQEQSNNKVFDQEKEGPDQQGLDMELLPS